MTLTNKAIWYIETHLRDPFTLENVARHVGVSRFHLSRAFQVSTGITVMAYVRARRMTEAAKVLAAGAPDILSVALSVGYQSHEAFTRAFRDAFQQAPSDVRRTGLPEPSRLQEPILMNEKLIDHLGEPRFENAPEIHVTGLAETYAGDASAAGIPEQWQRFVPHMGNVPGQTSGVTYGICRMDGEEMTYIAGAETDGTSDAPGELTKITLAPQRYAVFRHEGHISEIRRTWATIFEKWFPASGVTRAEAPDFERYSADFDPMAGTGYVEIWIPVEG